MPACCGEPEAVRQRHPVGHQAQTEPHLVEHIEVSGHRDRRAMRSYLDLWLAAHEKGRSDALPTVREGRRLRWIAASLAPLRGTIPDATLRRMQHALCLVIGSEAMVVMRDVCRLQPHDALAATRWAAEAILRAGMTETDGTVRARASPAMTDGAYESD